MFNRFAQLEANTRNAGLVLLFWIIVCVALAIFLPDSATKFDLITIFIWLANVPAAWFLSQAERRLGRNAWLFGLISLYPGFAVLHFIFLYATTRTSKDRNEV